MEEQAKPTFSEEFLVKLLRADLARKAYHQRDNEENKEVRKAEHDAWRATHKEEIAVYDKERYETHKEERKVHAEEYYDINTDKLKASSKKWREDNKEYCKERDAKNFQEHKEEAYQQHKEYAEKKPEIVQRIHRQANHKYRGLRKGAEGSFTEKEFRLKCESIGNKCVYCGKSGMKLVPDHIIPLSRGGSNFIANINPSCVSCNNSKRDMLVIEFEAYKVRVNNIITLK
jgi:5-methylcytosine-specific restriction endonuclease McrA